MQIFNDKAQTNFELCLGASNIVALHTEYEASAGVDITVTIIIIDKVVPYAGRNQSALTFSIAASQSSSQAIVGGCPHLTGSLLLKKQLSTVINSTLVTPNRLTVAEKMIVNYTFVLFQYNICC